ncbi:MAG TPA: hypothetical protein VGU20_18095 [Stellaceae bacterium]|nr:hypothetical protein [Stellaceae bacterium]
MSKLTDSVKNAFKTKGPDPADIRKRISEQEAKIASLVEQHADASVAWTSGTGPIAAMHSLDADLAAARAELRGLQAAVVRIEEKEAAAQKASRERIYAAQLGACKHHLNDRDKAGEKLTAALELVDVAYNELLASSDRALAACPIGQKIPLGAMLGLGEIKHAIEREMFRLMGDPEIGGKRTFPGAQSHDMKALNLPSTIEPLPVLLKRASEMVIATLKGGKPPAPTASPAPAVAATATVDPPVAAAPAANLSDELERQTLATGPKMDARFYTPQKARLS